MESSIKNTHAWGGSNAPTETAIRRFRRAGGKALILMGLALAIFHLGASSALATTVVLDSTNSYAFTIEAGVTLSLLQPVTRSIITITGGEFSIGTSDVATFPGITLIGNGSLLSGNRPRDLVSGNVAFTIKATGSGNLYDAKLTYIFNINDSGIGIAPSPNNSAGAAFNIQLATVAPATHWLGQTSNTWTASNWASNVGGTATTETPTSTDDITFSATGAMRQNTTLGADFTIHSLTIADSTPVTIGGANRLTIAGNAGTGINVLAGAGLFTMTANLTLGGASNTIAVGNIDGANINGVIDSSNGLTKTGTGFLRLYGANTYTGGTTISGGNLVLGNGTVTGAALGSGNVTVASGTTLVLSLATGETFSNNISNNNNLFASGGSNFTVAGAITGSGAFYKELAGTVAVTGNNSYTGGTVISSGALLVNNPAGSGTGSGAVMVTGGKLGGSGTIAGPVTLNSGGTIAPGASTSVSTAILKTGTVTWNGGGTLALELGASDATSDRLAITGALIKGAGMGFNVNVADAGGLGEQSLYTLISFTAGTTFAATDFALTLPGLPDGYKATLSLDADSLDLLLTYATTGTLIQNTGGSRTPLIADFTVDGAGMTGGPTASNRINSLLLTPGSTLQIFNTLTVQSGNVGDLGPGTTGIFGGTLFGPNGLFFKVNGDMNVTSTLLGNLTKTGDGALYLNGSLFGNLQVLAGLLGGNANIFGNVFNSGIVSPGNSPGTIRVSGNYAQSSAGTLRIEIAGRDAGEFDRLAVGGTAALDGTLRLVRLNNFHLKRGDRLTFLTADGGVSGEFATVVSDFTSGSILQTQVVYGANTVSLETTGSYADFANTFALTPNQRAVARALDGAIGERKLGRVIGYLDNRPLGDLPGDFDNIAPEELSSIFTISTALADVQSLNLQRRTDDLRSGVSGFSAAGLAMQGSAPGYSGHLLGGSGAAGPTGDDKDMKAEKSVLTLEEKKWGVFLTGVGEWVDVDGDGNARGYDITTGGFTLGVDYKVTPHFALGLAAGYAGTVADLTDDGRVWVNGGKLGLYATYFTGGFYVDTAVTGGYNSYDTKRSALQGTARGSTEGGELNVLVGAGYDWKIGALSIGPTATYNYTLVGVDSFTEHGSLAPLEIGSRNAESVRSAFGMKASYDWKCGGMVIKPEVRAAWQHEYGDKSYDLNASFSGGGSGNSFLVRGPELGRDSLLVGAGVAIQCSETFSTYVYYDGELGRERYERHSISGGVRIAF